MAVLLFAWSGLNGRNSISALTRLLCLPQRPDISSFEPEPRRRLADRIRGVARAEVAVVLLDHAGIDVPQGRSDDHEWGAVHDGVRGERVASDVEVGGR